MHPIHTPIYGWIIAHNCACYSYTSKTSNLS